MCSKITWDIFSMIFYAYYDRKREHFLDVKIYPSAADLKDFVSAREDSINKQKYSNGSLSFACGFCGQKLFD